MQRGDSYSFNGKLSETEAELHPGKIPFMRIHQSYLVNFFWIKSRTRTNVTMINGDRLPVSEDRQKAINRE